MVFPSIFSTTRLDFPKKIPFEGRALRTHLLSIPFSYTSILAILYFSSV